MTTVESGHVTPVVKVISVKASVVRAFDVFTRGFDTWWPREHHIGKSPMKRAIIEGRVGGRCYDEQVDGTDCPWGRVLVWEPPTRLVIAFQITPQWQYEPDLAKSSEVEITFTVRSRRHDARSPRAPSLRAIRRRRCGDEERGGCARRLGRPSRSLRQGSGAVIGSVGRLNSQL
jgi:hypothetical protein